MKKITKIIIATVISSVVLNLDSKSQTVYGSAESVLLQATNKETLILRGENNIDSASKPSAGITWQLNENATSQNTADLIKNKWSIYQSGDGNILTISGYYDNGTSKVPTPRIEINDYSASANPDGDITFYSYDLATDQNPKQALLVNGASGQVTIGNPHSNNNNTDSTSTLFVIGDISATGSISAKNGVKLHDVISIDYDMVVVSYDSRGRRLISTRDKDDYINGGWYFYDEGQETHHYRKISHGGHPTFIGSSLYVFDSQGKIQKSTALGTKTVIPGEDAVNISQDLMKKSRLFVEKAIWSEDYFISEKSMLANNDEDESSSGTDHVDESGGGQPDYVFYEDYDLPTLEKLEQYVKTNHHLPDVPSKNDIRDKGYLSLLNQTTGTLKNLEEQVLHNIAQEKKIALHEKKIRLQEQRLKAQDELIQSLMTRIEKLETNQK